jgi:hypothetical protein
MHLVRAILRGWAVTVRDPRARDWIVRTLEQRFRRAITVRSVRDGFSIRLA